MKNKEFWVARDRNGVLCIYNKRPSLAPSLGYYYGDDYWVLPKEFFVWLKFEDGPKKLVGYENEWI